MTIKRVNDRIQAAMWSRALAAISCLWVAGVFVAAAWKLLSDGVDLYEPAPLFVLVVGGPIVVLTLAYAAYSMGTKVSVSLAVLVVFTVGAMFAVIAFKEHRREQARKEADRQQAELAERKRKAFIEFRGECDALAAQRRRNEVYSASCIAAKSGLDFDTFDYFSIRSSESIRHGLYTP